MEKSPKKRSRPPKYPTSGNLPWNPKAKASSQLHARNGETGDSSLENEAYNAEAFAMEDTQMVDRALIAGVNRPNLRPRKRSGKKITFAGGTGGEKSPEGGFKEQQEFNRHANSPTLCIGLDSLKCASQSPVELMIVDQDLPRNSLIHERGVEAEFAVNGTPFMDAVVKVFCTHTEPNFSLPWQRKRQYSSNSSGFIIEGRRVLTNAHSVEHQTQIKVKKRGSETKFLATILAIGTECDIAMLAVENDEFWNGVTPVEFGGLPKLQDAVTVVGYPIGGDTISVTSGVVSRIEITAYVHGATELLGVQIDAAINAGNSGGPAFNERGQCVGIAFQSLKHEDAENIGYVIPTTVISHFIQDFQHNGGYTGFPILGVEWQKMENSDLRRSLGLKPNQKGVRIRRIEPTAPAAKYLRASDILLSFDGVDIANDGTVPFRHGERIGFSYLVSQKYNGDEAPVRILREGKILEFDVKVTNHCRLVPAHNKGKPPSYYIIAGIVFTVVSVPYFRSEYGKDYDFDAPVKLLEKLMHSMAQTEDEQLVVISQVLVSDINIGYEDIVNTQVLKFNGVPVKNLKQLAQMVENCREEFLKLELEYQQVVVLETQAAKEATPEILAIHGIPSPMSDDLKS